MFKPMLAVDAEESQLRFPLLASKKFDGIRALIQERKVMGRSLKPIRNKNVQQMFSKLPEGLDGELVFGDPLSEGCCRNTSSVVNSDDKPAEGIQYYVFDKYGSKGYAERLIDACNCLKDIDTSNIIVVEHILVNNLQEFLVLKEQWLQEGHEGIIIRSIFGPYKQGRSSLNEGYLLRVKRLRDSEAIVLDTYEQMHNANPATTNELGHTTHSSHQAGKIPAGVLGGLNVRDIKSGVEFKVGNGFDAEMRASLWKIRETLVGKIVKYKFTPYGEKEKPRFPVWIAWRDPVDMS